jgi:hypothetical protein
LAKSEVRNGIFIPYFPVFFSRLQAKKVLNSFVYFDKTRQDEGSYFESVKANSWKEKDSPFGKLRTGVSMPTET